MISHSQKGFRRFIERFQSRLSKRIALLIFGSIVVIETILIIPSIAKRKQEIFSQLKEVSDAKITWIMMSYSKDSDAKILAEVAQLDRMSSLILGGAVYKSNGQLVGTFGEPPKLSFSELESNKTLRLQKNSRFDGVWSAAKMQSDYTIVIRHDASSVGPELLAYVGRIVGLVIIISAFITITVWIALEPLAIAPILQLRSDLLVAGEAVRHDEDPPGFYSASIERKDELYHVRLINHNIMAG